MKNSLILVVLSLLIGFATAWLIKPDATASNDEAATVRHARKSSQRGHSDSTASADAKRSRTSEASISSSVKVIGAEDELDEETRKQIEDAQLKQQKMVRDRLEKKYAIEIDAMIAELGLDAEQEKALRAYYEQRMDMLSSSDPMEMATDPDKIKLMAAAMRGDGLADAMAEHLDDDQKEALEAMQERKQRNKIEAVAMKDLAKVQQVLDLSDEQRDAVYDVLVEEANDKVESESDTNVVMNGMMSNMGVDMDLGDVDMGSMMSLSTQGEDGEGGEDIDRESIITKLKEDRQKKIDTKVERMAPILNDNQLKQYRNHLENKGGMFNMMIQGM